MIRSQQKQALERQCGQSGVAAARTDVNSQDDAKKEAKTLHPERDVEKAESDQCALKFFANLHTNDLTWRMF